MNKEALALELRNEMYSFLTELIDEFATSETISHDTFNKAINIRSNIIADDDLWDGMDDADADSKLNIDGVNILAKFSKEIAKQSDCPSEFLDIVNKEFWNLI